MMYTCPICNKQYSTATEMAVCVTKCAREADKERNEELLAKLDKEVTNAIDAARTAIDKYNMASKEHYYDFTIHKNRKLVLIEGGLEAPRGEIGVKNEAEDLAKDFKTYLNKEYGKAAQETKLDPLTKRVREIGAEAYKTVADSGFASEEDLAEIQRTIDSYEEEFAKLTNAIEKQKYIEEYQKAVNFIKMAYELFA